jgi:PIN domain nuclease of toxin-antitoxin system
MQYLLDTVTVIRHFTESGKIGEKAKNILNSRQHSFFISVISLIEILYLSEKKRIKINLTETINEIEKSSLYTIVDLTPDIVKTAEKLKFPELHDRLILSTAKWLGIPVLSSDKHFKKVKTIEVVWD